MIVLVMNTISDLLLQTSTAVVQLIFTFVVEQASFLDIIYKKLRMTFMSE